MKRAMLEQLAAAARENRPMVRALDSKSGEERLIDPAADHSPLGQAAANALARDASGSVLVETRSWFLTVYNVPWEIVMIGAVHIAQALAQLALAAGYRVRVIDPRPAYAAEERFPGIRLVREWPDDALAAEPLTPRSALIALAHDPKLDDPALVAGLRAHAGYVGALGSKRTHGRRLARLRELGFSEQELAKIYGPVGLAIGARSPGEIAVAILAELVQVRRARKDRIGGIILAAGLSSRMGFNKLAAEVGGKPLVRHVAEAALAGGLDPVIAVTGNEPAAIKKALAGLAIVFVHNPDYADGLSFSLRHGIDALPGDCAGAMVLLGDMPGIGADLIAKVKAGFDPGQGAAICVATAHGERGHPVLWGRQFFPEIARLSGDNGARALMAHHAAQVREIESDDDAPLADIDTKADLDGFSSRNRIK